MVWSPDWRRCVGNEYRDGIAPKERNLGREILSPEVSSFSITHSKSYLRTIRPAGRRVDIEGYCSPKGLSGFQSLYLGNILLTRHRECMNSGVARQPLSWIRTVPRGQRLLGRPNISNHHSNRKNLIDFDYFPLRRDFRDKRPFLRNQKLRGAAKRQHREEASAPSHINSDLATSCRHLIPDRCPDPYSLFPVPYL